MVSGLKISNFKITTMVRGWGWGVGGPTKLYTHLRFVKKCTNCKREGATHCLTLNACIEWRSLAFRALSLKDFWSLKIEESLQRSTFVF